MSLGFTMNWICPLCGHENYTRVEVHAGEREFDTEPERLVCENDDGGCQSTIYVSAKVRISLSPNTYVLERRTPPREPPAVHSPDEYMRRVELNAQAIMDPDEFQAWRQRRHLRHSMKAALSPEEFREWEQAQQQAEDGDDE